MYDILCLGLEYCDPMIHSSSDHNALKLCIPTVLHNHSKHYYLNQWIKGLQDYWKPNIYQEIKLLKHGWTKEIQQNQLK